MSRKRNKIPLIALVVSLLTLAGCATVPPSKRDPRDPWQRMNRATFRVDRKFYDVIGKPLARTYVRVMPHAIRTGITNFFHNLTYPTVIVNALLQGQLKPFFKDTGRLVVNSTLGIGGLFDPAAHMGLGREDRDFGQTFGKWGIPTGPYLVLPILGPSDLRDAIGLVPAEYTDPVHYVNNTTASYSLRGVSAMDTAAGLLPILRLDDQAYDPYAFARNAYLSHRKFMVNGPAKHNGAEQELKELGSGND